MASRIPGIEEWTRTTPEQPQTPATDAFALRAGSMVHDYNNLLNTIIGYCTILLDTLPEGNRARHGLQQIQAAGEQAAVLTRELRALGKGLMTPQR